MIHSIPSRARIFILTLIFFFNSRPVNLNVTGQPVETSRESKSLTTESIPVVVSRGPHDRVVEWTATVSDGSGADVVYTNSYTEIATGMHYRDSSGEWRDTVPAFEPEQGGGWQRGVLIRPPWPLISVSRAR